MRSSGPSCAANRSGRCGRSSWQPGPGRLTLADREEISLGLRAGDSFTAIAVRLGKAVSTVSREVAGNGGRNDYRAWRAHQRARERARRPKTAEAEPCPAGRPGHAVAARVVVAAGDRRPVADGVRRRSDDAGEPRDDLPGPVRAGPRRATPRAGPMPAHRTGQTAPRRRPENTGQLRDMVMISERPAEAEDRAVPATGRVT